MAASEIETSERSTKNKICDYLNDFYTEYVPKDKRTYNLALPIFGFAVSCFTFGMVMEIAEFNIRKSANITYSYGYMAIAGACALDLYNGLENKNKKHFLFWMALKCSEVIMSIVTTSLCHSSTSTDELLVMSLLNMIVLVSLLIYVGRRAKLTQTINLQEQQTVYDQNTIKPRLQIFQEPIYRNVY